MVGTRSFPAMGSRIAAAAALALAWTPAAARADQIDVCVDAAEQAQRLQIDGRLASAREKLLICSKPQCVSVIRDDCAKWLAALEGAIPSVVIRAVDAAGADVVDVGVYADGRLLASRLDGNDIRIDPGEHSFRFVRDGSAPVDQKVLVRQGEQHRLLSVVFPASAAAAAPATASGAAPEAKDGARDRVASPVRIGASWPIAALATGAVALAVASTLWISGFVDHSTMGSSCAPTHACSQSAIDSAHGKLVVGDVVGGVGFGLIAIGGGMFALGVGAHPSQPGARVSLTGRF